MTQPILWGRGSSTNVQKVLWTCAELEITPERRIVGGPHGGTDTDAFGALNPNRTVPVWQDGALVLWESQAIMRHLARNHDALYGSDEAGRCAVDRQLDWFATVFFPPIRTLFLDVYTRGTLEITSEPAQAALTVLHAKMDLAERSLEDSAFFAGEAFSLADIVMAIGLNRASGLPYEITIPARLADWLSTQRNRPAFAIATSDEPKMPGTLERAPA